MPFHLFGIITAYQGGHVKFVTRLSVYTSGCEGVGWTWNQAGTCNNSGLQRGANERSADAGAFYSPGNNAVIKLTLPTKLTLLAALCAAACAGASASTTRPFALVPTPSEVLSPRLPPPTILCSSSPLRHIVLHVTALPAGRALVLTVGVADKNNAKPGVARIVSQTPDGRGGEKVAVEAALKPHRPTEISLSPAAAKTVANP